MTTTIRLKIYKDIDADTEKKILKLKGSLIINGFTDIVHIDDDGLDYHMNYFGIEAEKKEMVIAFIESFKNDQNLLHVLSLV